MQTSADLFIEEEKNTDIKNISDLRFSKYTALFIRLCEHGVINSLAGGSRPTQEAFSPTSSSGYVLCLDIWIVLILTFFSERISSQCLSDF